MAIEYLIPEIINKYRDIRYSWYLPKYSVVKLIKMNDCFQQTLYSFDTES